MLISGGEACVQTLRCLSWGRIAPPLAGDQTRYKWLQIALSGCFAAWSISVLLWGMKMVAPGSLGPKLKVCTPNSSMSPHRKAVNYYCLPGFHPSSVFTQPVTNHFFYLCHMTPFESPNFIDSCSVHLHIPPRGTRGSQWSSVSYWDTCREQLPHPATFLVYGKLRRKRNLDPLFAADFPAQMLGNSTALRCPHYFCDPKDPETLLFHLGFCTASPSEPLKQFGPTRADF